MSEKTLKTRIIHKHDIEDNWLKATSFIPKQGELIIYDIDDAHQYERFKIGDGVKNVNDLPFATDDKVDKIEGKGLSKNDLTDALKVSYDNAVNAKHTHDNKSVLDATTASYTTDEKSKLSKIASGANNYTLPVAGSALGGIKSGTDITVDANGNVSVNDDSHSHIISNVDGLQDALNAKVPTSRKVNGKALSSDITLSAGDVGADASGSAADALTSAKAYTDTAVANLVDSAPEALNTLGELATALSEHEDAYDALLETVGGKVNKENGKGLSTNDLTDSLKANYNAAYTHSGTAHAPSNAEKNQNAFSNVVVGSTTIAADTATDSLTLVGSNVTLTPDATNDKITIGITKANVTDALGYTPPSTDTKYAHPTYTAKSSGLYNVTVDSTGHVSATTTVTKLDIMALGIPGTNTGATAVNVSGTGNAVTDALYLSDTRTLELIRGGPFTVASVVPNNIGEIKTKYRCSQKGYTGGSSTYWYYKLCTLPADNTGNYASAIISGRIGGWQSDNMSYINALLWNRDSTGIALMDIAGSASSMSNVWDRCEIVMYDNSDNTCTVYAKCNQYFVFDLDIEVFQSTATLDYNGIYTTSVSGTLSAQASTSTRRVEIVNGKLLVNGSSSVPTFTYDSSTKTLTIS